MEDAIDPILLMVNVCELLFISNLTIVSPIPGLIHRISKSFVNVAVTLGLEHVWFISTSTSSPFCCHRRE